MPRLLLEGKSLTGLLAQVREEHGPDVRIVAADKVRTGGVGGFFTRESYAVTIELDEAPPGGAVPPVMHDLVDTTTGTNRTPDVHPVMHDRAAAAQAPGSLLDLAAAIDAAEAAEAGVVLGTAPTRTEIHLPGLSTTTPGFAEILARLATLDEVSAPQAAPTLAPEPAFSAATTVAAEPALSAATTVAPEPASWDKLRAVLAEIAPGVDLGTGGPVVLILTPPAPATPPTLAAPVAEPAIPRQARHRRVGNSEVVSVATD